MVSLASNNQVKDYRRQKADCVTAANTCYYYYSDNWQVLAEYDGYGSMGNLTQAFIYGNYIDEAVMMLNYSGTTGAYYYLHDHLYSPAALVNSSGIVVERYEYDAYGKVTIIDGTFANTRSASSYDNPYYFTGRRLDQLDYNSQTSEYDFAIMYYRNRYYDTYTGRFYTKDPLGITPSPTKPNAFKQTMQMADGLNLYEYVSSKSIIFFDPYGLLIIKKGKDYTASSNIIVSPKNTNKTVQSIIASGEFIEWQKYKSTSILSDKKIKKYQLKDAEWQIKKTYECVLVKCRPELRVKEDLLGEAETETTSPYSIGLGMPISLGSGIWAGVSGNWKVVVGRTNEANGYDKNSCAYESASIKSYWIKTFSSGASISWGGVSVGTGGIFEKKPKVLATSITDKYVVSCCKIGSKPYIDIKIKASFIKE
jgi:RHS repeat-associated protein